MEEIVRCESEIQSKDSKMKRFHEQVSVGYTQVVEVDNLSHRLFEKCLKYISDKIKTITDKDKPPMVRKSYERLGIAVAAPIGDDVKAENISSMASEENEQLSSPTRTPS